MKITSVIFGLTGLLAATPALAQPAAATGSRTTAAPGSGQTMTAPDTKAFAPLANQQPRPVFTIFNMPVVVWAPVQPHYSSRSNLDAAANPTWLNGLNPM